MQSKFLAKIKEKKNRGKVFLFLVLIIPGLALLGWGLVEFGGELGFNLGSQKVEGTIVATAYFTGYSKSRNAAFLVTPVVEYKVGGKSYQAKGNNYVNASEVKIGSTLTVSYNPNNPAEARVDNFRVDYINVIVWIALGISEIGFVVMIYVFIWLFGKPKNQPLEAKNRARSRP